MDNKQEVQAASKGLLQRAIDFLFKGLDKIISESIEEKSRLKAKEAEAVEKEGKMGKRYTFIVDEEGYDGGAYVVTWPIQGKKDLIYVESVTPFGTDDEGNEIELKKVKPSVVKQANFGKKLIDLFVSSGYNVVVEEAKDNDEEEKLDLSEQAEAKEEEAESVEDVFVPDEGVKNATELTSSTWKFKAKLKKVTASDEITLLSVDYSDANPQDVWNAICDIAEDAEFCQQLPDDEECCVAVGEDSDGNYIVDNIEDIKINPGDVARYLYGLTVDTSNNLKALSSACSDSQFRSFYEGISWMLSDMINSLTALRIITEHVYPNPGLITCTGQDYTEGISGKDAIVKLKDAIQGLTDTISLKGLCFGDIHGQALMQACNNLEARIACDLNPYLEANTL